MSGITGSQTNNWLKENWIVDEKLDQFQPLGSKSPLLDVATKKPVEGGEIVVPYLKKIDSLGSVYQNKVSVAERDNSNLYNEFGSFRLDGTKEEDDFCYLQDRISIERKLVLATKTNAGAAFSLLDFAIKMKMKTLYSAIARLMYGERPKTQILIKNVSKYKGGLTHHCAIEDDNYVGGYRRLEQSDILFKSALNEQSVGYYDLSKNLEKGINLGTQIIRKVIDASRQIYVGSDTRNAGAIRSIGLTRLHFNPLLYFTILSSQYLVNGTNVLKSAMPKDEIDWKNPQKHPVFFLKLPYGDVPLYMDFACPLRWIYGFNETFLQNIHFGKNLVNFQEESGNYILLDRDGSNHHYVGMDSMHMLVSSVPSMIFALQLDEETYSNDLLYEKAVPEVELQLDA